METKIPLYREQGKIPPPPQGIDSGLRSDCNDRPLGDVAGDRLLGDITRLPGDSSARVTLGGLRAQVEDAREREVEGRAHRG